MLTEDELSVFSAIVSEPYEWCRRHLSDDYGWRVDPCVSRLVALDLVTGCKLRPTYEGIRYAQELGLRLGGKHPRGVKRRMVEEHFRNGETEVRPIMEKTGLSQPVVRYYLKEFLSQSESQSQARR